MFKASILTSPSELHDGNFWASSMIHQMGIGVVDYAEFDLSSSEGVEYTETKKYIKQVRTAADATGTKLFYFCYKWPTPNDYDSRNNLSAHWIKPGESVVALRMVPGIIIQDYVGTDYTYTDGTYLGSLDISCAWGSVAHGTALYVTAKGVLDVVSPGVGVTAKARFIEKKGNWVTYTTV